MVTWDKECLHRSCHHGVCCVLIWDSCGFKAGEERVFLRKLFSFVVLSLTTWNVQTVVIGLISPL